MHAQFIFPSSDYNSELISTVIKIQKVLCLLLIAKFFSLNLFQISFQKAYLLSKRKIFAFDESVIHEENNDQLLKFNAVEHAQEVCQISARFSFSSIQYMLCAKGFTPIFLFSILETDDLGI